MLQKSDITSIAASVGLDYPRLAAFLEVESGSHGFDPKTGKIIIQFEPTWFHRYLTDFRVDHSFLAQTVDKKKLYRLGSRKNGEWIELTNGVEGQTGEWEAFNKAFKIHPEAAMLSTSIGMGQIMGFHYKRLGYKSVGEMWDSFKTGEKAQVAATARFLKTDAKLFKALLSGDWRTVAYLYNGELYERNDYHNKLARAFVKHSKL